MLTQYEEERKLKKKLQNAKNKRAKKMHQKIAPKIVQKTYKHEPIMRPRI